LCIYYVFCVGELTTQVVNYGQKMYSLFLHKLTPVVSKQHFLYLALLCHVAFTTWKHTGYKTFS